MSDASHAVFSAAPIWLRADLLNGMLRGIERESLRMQANGFLSKQPHPQHLGAALTHPYITTDYSEALLEFITPPQKTIQAALEFLTQLHLYTAQHLPKGESLWPLSMPCMLDNDEDSIPLAQYGSSNIGKFKTLYRHGLGVRYGRRMQTIAGVHYNVSFSDSLFNVLQQQETESQLKALCLQDYRSHRYFGLIRNFIRSIPMVMYLLGASPSICRCFVTGRTHNLQPLIAGTLYLPDATALRMGRLGYQNSTQRKLGIHYNHLSGYLQGMAKAVNSSYPEFQVIGLEDAHGEPIQINDHVLQIENEYYSLIRPKQPPIGAESPSAALKNRGVAYVELRALDVNPYSAIGIPQESAAFLEILALYCLINPSPEIDDAEQDLIDQNQANTVNSGRHPDLTLETLNGCVKLRAWIKQHLVHMQSFATLLDEAHASTLYSDALRLMHTRCDDVEQTLSYQMLEQTKQAGGTWNFGAQLAQQYLQAHCATALDAATQQHFDDVSATSLLQQQHLESAQQISFEEYLAPYRNLVENT